MHTINAATTCHMPGVHAASCASFVLMDTFIVQIRRLRSQSSTYAKWLSTQGRLGHFLDFFFFGSVPGPALFLVLEPSNLQHLAVQLAWYGHSGLRQRHRRHMLAPASLASMLKSCAAAPCNAHLSACTATDLSVTLHYCSVRGRVQASSTRSSRPCDVAAFHARSRPR